MQYSAFAETIQGITLVQEADSLPTIYCDMDGVLCDFAQGIANMFKLKSKDHTTETLMIKKNLLSVKQ